MLTVQFLQQGVVCGFGEVALLIQQCQETQFLQREITILIIILIIIAPLC